MNESKNNHPNPAVIEKFLAVQEQEIIMRGKELEIRKQANEFSHEYATAALQANKEDRECSRRHEATVINNRYIFSGIVLLFLMSLVGFALYLNKDQIVLEAMKAILFFGSGGIGGYAYAKNKKEPDQSEDN